MEDHASVYAEVLNEIPAKKYHVIAHSMGGAVGLLLPPTLLRSVLSFSNCEGNLVGEDCGIVSRKTADVSFPEFKRNVWPEIKSLSKSLGRGRLFLDSALPKGRPQNQCQEKHAADDEWPRNQVQVFGHANAHRRSHPSGQRIQQRRLPRDG